MGAPPNGNGNAFIPRYGVIISTVGVVILIIGGFWGAVIGPITVRQDKLDGKLDAHLSIREHEEFKSRLDQRITQLNNDLLRLAEVVVPRKEHEATSGTLNVTIKTMQDRINEIRRDTYQTVTVGDDLKRLQGEISELRKQLHSK